MPSQVKKKPEPVAINTPVEMCENYVNLNEEKKACEATLGILKKPMLALIPKGRTATKFVATRDGKKGNYIVKEVKQDRRTVDNSLLTTLLIEKDLIGKANKVVADETKVAQLVESGELTNADIEKCLSGSRYSYPLVEFKEMK